MRPPSVAQANFFSHTIIFRFKLLAILTIINAHMFSMQKNNLVVLDVTEPKIEVIAFVLPNESSRRPLRRFAVTIDYVEEMTGINFFEALEDGLEEQIEGSYSVQHWGMLRCCETTLVGKNCFVLSG